MKVTAAAAIMGLATLVGAANTERHQARDLDTTLRVMNNVLDQMVVVDNVISAFWDTSDLPAVQEAGTKMIAIIRASDEDILAMTPVPLQDAIAFQPLSDKLNAQGDKLLEGVEAKVPLFGRAAVCPTMHTAVSTIGAGVVKLMNDVSDKFPQEGRQNNANTIQHFTDSFASAIAKLKACADVNNAGGSGKPRGGDYDSAPAATWKPQATGTGVLPPPRATGAARNGTEGAVKAPIVTAGASSVVAKGFAAALVAALFL
ncbi:hypothetical protein MGG_08354 [Pyricularia oryzae 70-15]|uniref:Cell wall protein n=3 Tax=Pyricularia oryzae TaxID=318829 RepID=G4MWD9_PYRO7|nr:uncharacterized protein MGG_08354 [Pyricularia oryzae 70-15]EHA55899.1 hypothetical protein MGG_08354 [Pyricularia oryzae 70-15]ELQ33509.1 hypothetical protein OOU_Y34scaffold00930g1 [Pyricularia oryzae Y34]KAI7911166.1 hypothetical protein M0657_011071 [Pyricularia oryzae]KAI7911606.1 hypothetical protein M9X92_010452 [Pyricularia oryzae]